MIICFDTETTGFRPMGDETGIRDEILQLSIIGEDENGNVSVLFDEFFRPADELIERGWSAAEAVNGISPASTIERKPISCYKELIQSIIDKADTIVGYNGGFDANFLEAAGICIDREKMFDVMLAFAPIYGDWNEDKQSYKWQKLTRCAEYYNFTWDESAHNSLGDCKATLYCYHKIMESA